MSSITLAGVFMRYTATSGVDRMPRRKSRSYKLDNVATSQRLSGASVLARIGQERRRPPNVGEIYLTSSKNRQRAFFLANQGEYSAVVRACHGAPFRRRGAKITRVIIPHLTQKTTRVFLFG